MKKKMFLPIVALISVGMLAGCNTNPSSSSPATSTSTPAASSTSQGLVLTSLSITNKTDLQKTWNVGEDTRTIEITADPTQNITSLITTGKLTITSSDPTVVTAVGKVLYAQKHGTSTITIACGGKTDTVDIEITDKVTLTPAENVLDVAGTTHFEIASTNIEATATAASSYTWTSSDTAVATVDATGTVTAVADGTTTIKAAFTAGPKTFSEYEITVKAGGEVYTACKDVIKKDTAYVVKGTVGAISGSGFVLDDGNNTAYIYGITNVSVDDYVKVSGTTTIYNNNGEMEFGKDSIVTPLIKPTGTTTLEAVPLTSALVDSIKKSNPTTSRALYVKYSYRTFATLVNSYTALSFIGNSTTIEPNKYSGKITTGAYYDVTGYVIAYMSSGYVDLMVSSLEEVDSTTITESIALPKQTSAIVVKGETSQLEIYTAAKGTKDATGKVTLEDSTITWTTSDATVATVDDKGLVTGVASGTATVTGTVFGKSYANEITVIRNISDHKGKAEVNIDNYKTTSDFTLTGITEFTSNKVTYLSFGKSSKSSIATKGLTGIGGIDISLKGNYNNLKVYLGTDATGTEIDPAYSSSITNGLKWTYVTSSDVDSIFIVNPSTYYVSCISVVAHYKLAA